MVPISWSLGGCFFGGRRPEPAAAEVLRASALVTNPSALPVLRVQNWAAFVGMESS